MNRRNNRMTGWALTILVILVVVVYRTRMVPNVIISYAPQLPGNQYEFTAAMQNPPKKGVGWVLTRTSDAKFYLVEVYSNQTPLRAFKTVSTGKTVQPGHTYKIVGTLKIDELPYQASTLSVDSNGKSAKIIFVPIKQQASSTGGSTQNSTPSNASNSAATNNGVANNASSNATTANQKP